MTRFEILGLFTAFLTPVTCKELAKHTRHPNSHTRSFQASFATRLRRLKSYGLLQRKRYRSGFIFRSKREFYHWTLTEKGKDRLAWAKSRGFV
jgi:hypothetical protein